MRAMPGGQGDQGLCPLRLNPDIRCHFREEPPAWQGTPADAWACRGNPESMKARTGDGLRGSSIAIVKKKYLTPVFRSALFHFFFHSVKFFFGNFAFGIASFENIQGTILCLPGNIF
jgi:hypothetical protein